MIKYFYDIMLWIFLTFVLYGKFFKKE